jgi:hypothetical protein
VPGQPGAGGIRAHALRIFSSQEELADRGEVQRSTATDGPDHLHAAALAVGTLDVDDLVALPHGEVDGLVRELVQFAHRAQRGFPDVQPRLHQVAEFQQAHAEPVTAGLRAIDETADREVVQDAVGGGGVQPGGRADRLQRGRLGLRG